jgi:exosortase/archaeosortase
MYTWGYMIVACLSYLGVIIQLRTDYSITDYISFITIIAIQLSAFTVLLFVTKTETLVSYSIAILTLAVLHALVFLYYFVFNDIPPLDKVIAELAIWFGWTLYATYIIYKSNRIFGFKNRFKKQ